MLSNGPRAVSAPPVEGAPALSKRYLFRYAWQLARSASLKFGGSRSQYFAVALKESWTAFATSATNQECHRMAIAGDRLRHRTEPLSYSKSFVSAARRADVRLGDSYVKAF
jgi:hypothetical protein